MRSLSWKVVSHGHHPLDVSVVRIVVGDVPEGDKGEVQRLDPQHHDDRQPPPAQRGPPRCSLKPLVGTAIHGGVYFRTLRPRYHANNISVGSYLSHPARSKRISRASSASPTRKRAALLRPRQTRDYRGPSATASGALVASRRGGSGRRFSPSRSLSLASRRDSAPTTAPAKDFDV